MTGNANPQSDIKHRSDSRARAEMFKLYHQFIGNLLIMSGASGTDADGWLTDLRSGFSGEISGLHCASDGCCYSQVTMRFSVDQDLWPRLENPPGDLRARLIAAAHDGAERVESGLQSEREAERESQRRDSAAREHENRKRADRSSEEARALLRVRYREGDMVFGASADPGRPGHLGVVGCHVGPSLTVTYRSPRQNVAIVAETYDGELRIVLYRVDAAREGERRFDTTDSPGKPVRRILAVFSDDRLAGGDVERLLANSNSDEALIAEVRCDKSSAE